MTRRIGRIAVALILVLIGAGTVAAGGWATITPDEGAGTVQPKEDEPVELGFTVLQHGETAAPWESPTVVATNTLTGEVLEVAAKSDGPDGHFTAVVTFPEAGLWSWRVELADLLVEASASMPVSVLTADGVAPALDAPTAVRIADLAADQVRRELREEHGARLNELQTQLDSQESVITSLRGQLGKATAAAGGPVAATSEGLPAVAVVLLSVLAGAASAFVLLMLARPTRMAPPSASAGYAPTAR